MNDKATLYFVFLAIIVVFGWLYFDQQFKEKLIGQWSAEFNKGESSQEHLTALKLTFKRDGSFEYEGKTFKDLGGREIIKYKNSQMVQDSKGSISTTQSFRGHYEQKGHKLLIAIEKPQEDMMIDPFTLAEASNQGSGQMTVTGRIDYKDNVLEIQGFEGASRVGFSKNGSAHLNALVLNKRNDDGRGRSFVDPAYADDALPNVAAGEQYQRPTRVRKSSVKSVENTSFWGDPQAQPKQEQPNYVPATVEEIAQVNKSNEMNLSTEDLKSKCQNADSIACDVMGTRLLNSGQGEEAKGWFEKGCQLNDKDSCEQYFKLK